jgi:hypothetical protein
VNKRLQGRLVGAVMAMRPERVRFIQRPIAEDHVVHGARRDEDKARHTCLERCLKELQRTGQIDPEERIGIAMTAGASIARATPLDGAVDDRVYAADELPRCGEIPQFTGQPFEGDIVETAAVAALAIPSAQVVPGAGEMICDVAPEKTCCTGERDLHGVFLGSHLKWRPASACQARDNG